MRGKQVLVIGLAKSGRASAMLLAGDGAVVTINDRKEAEQLNAEDAEFLRRNPKIRYVGGGHPAELVGPDTALVVKNPGVPLHLPPLQKAAELGVPVITEVELAFWKIKAPIVAITGTNGKTTTTALTGEIYKAGGFRTYVAGNIGLPLSAIANEVRPEDRVVAELSSFQLEGTICFRPKISTVLNITPDHLDHHKTMEAYREAKALIFTNQGGGDVCVLNADDPESYGLRHLPTCPVYLFSRKQEVEQGAFVRDGVIILRDSRGEVPVCAVKDMAMPGAHNLENALAAALLSWLGGVLPAVIASVLQTFPGVANRLEYVRTLDGVDYINDSKGTNADASIKALEAFPQKKILIAGGYEKDADFSDFARVVRKHASHVVLIGQVAGRIAAALKAAGFSQYSFAESLEDAVKAAQAKAQPNDVVLLSPACASWDMFKDFEERGERFRKAVWGLGGEKDGR